jgi:glycosyltransferase involved in cell wall biosynthesis
LVIGTGSGRRALENEAGPELGERVRLIGPVPREEVPAYLAAMDIGSLPQSVDQVGGFRYSTKLAEYVAAGLPIVTGQIPASYDLDTGWIWRMPGDAPWDPHYLDGLVTMIERVTSEEIDQKRQAMIDQPPNSHQPADGTRVSRFLLDVIEREHIDESQN